MNNKKELKFISELPLYFETKNAIFVHAGINLNVQDWKQDKRYMLWEKKEFVLNNKIPDKRVFFGHTPTNFIHKDKDNHNIWISSDEMKVGIDGRVSSGGQLNAIKVDNEGNIVDTAFFT